MPTPTLLETSPISPVWAGHRVGFMLQTRGEFQYAAYYDAQRDMMLAKRQLGSQTWQIVPVPGEQSSPFGAQKTPTRVGWDSHNYITFSFDSDGQLHLSGNLHCNPLLYFRTEKPGDITTLRRIDFMTGQRESRVTYPTFIHTGDGTMIFRYRDGGSGKGDELYNRYDPATQRWTRHIDTAFTDGKGKMNAYPMGPTLGPDGYFHLVWIWRDTPHCETNHDISYARSKDLKHWETSEGTPLQMPITLESGEVVDPVKAGGGAINNNTRIGFDSRGRVVVTYHKYDAQGNTQIYNARKENGAWRSVPATNWDHRWEFSGTGTIIGEVGVQPVKVLNDGRLVQSWWNAWSGRDGCVLDETTLEPKGPYIAPRAHPESLDLLESKFPGMEVMFAGDAGDAPRSGARYLLRWEALPANRDQTRPEPWPEPSMLRVVKVGS